MTPIQKSGLMTSLKTRLVRRESICARPRLLVHCETLEATSCLLPPDRRGSGVDSPSCVNYTPGFDRCHIRHRMLYLLLTLASFFLFHVDDSYASCPNWLYDSGLQRHEDIYIYCTLRSVDLYVRNVF